MGNRGWGGGGQGLEQAAEGGFVISLRSGEMRRPPPWGCGEGCTLVGASSQPGCFCIEGPVPAGHVRAKEKV